MQWLGPAFLLVLAWACIANSAAAAPALQIQDEPLQLNLATQVEYLRNAPATATVAEIAERTGFSQPAQRPRFGYVKGPVWVRARLRLPAQRDYVLEVSHAQVDQLSLFVPGADGAFRETKTGELLPASSRPLRHNAFAFPLRGTGEEQVIFLRAQTSASLLLPLTLWRGDTFAQHAREDALFRGLYFGFLVALALYNLFVFLSVRDRAYIFYVAWLGCYGLGQANFSGYATAYLWPDAPNWAVQATATLTLIGASMGLWFVREMTNIARSAPRLDLLARRLPWVGLAVAPLLSVWYVELLSVAVGLSMLVWAFVLAPIYVGVRNGYRPARFVAVGWAALMPSSAIFALRYLDLLPPNAWTTHVPALGAAAEALLLSFALADRISLLRAEKARALADRADLSQRLIRAQDEERRRLARELHDGLGQSLLVVVNRLKRALKRRDDEHIAETTELAAAAIKDLRTTAQQLHPAGLERLGLKAAIEQATARVSAASGVRVEVECQPSVDELPPDAQLHLYRIVQEALSNVVKHANAKHAGVRLEGNARTVLLEVTDDGSGPSNGSAAGGLGLSSIRERALALGGTLEFGGHVGGGTRLRVESDAIRSSDR